MKKLLNITRVPYEKTKTGNMLASRCGGGGPGGTCGGGCSCGNGVRKKGKSSKIYADHRSHTCLLVGRLKDALFY